MELLHRLCLIRDFTLPQFELTPLEFNSETDEEGGELLLDDIVASIGAEPRAVPLVQPMPTAGELQASIELHLGAARHREPPLSPADELRDALTELRRSLA